TAWGFLHLLLLVCFRRLAFFLRVVLRILVVFLVQSVLSLRDRGYYDIEFVGGYYDVAEIFAFQDSGHLAALGSRTIAGGQAAIGAKILGFAEFSAGSRSRNEHVF